MKNKNEEKFSFTPAIITVFVVIIGIFIISNYFSKQASNQPNNISTETTESFKVITLGEKEEKVGDFTYSFEWFEIGNKLDSNNFVITNTDYFKSISKASSQFIVVVLTAKNDGVSPHSVTINNINLIDDQGRQYKQYLPNTGDPEYYSLSQISGFHYTNNTTVPIKPIATFPLKGNTKNPGLIGKTAFIFETGKDIKSLQFVLSVKQD